MEGFVSEKYVDCHQQQIVDHRSLPNLLQMSLDILKQKKNLVKMQWSLLRDYTFLNSN